MCMRMSWNIWRNAGLAKLSRKGRQIIATHSGHHVPLGVQGLVATSIREVITSARR